METACGNQHFGSSEEQASDMLLGGDSTEKARAGSVRMRNFLEGIGGVMGRNNWSKGRKVRHVW